ncbi:MAG: tRNA(Ile2) 2-agmatinylcytidine synthetase [Methanomicrobiales archaeon HGW-Methanomicrobiales-4]|nr:MAG: tRNA(Ile2) 2-agmatinylcytidine synthetase [Methanomicrobiales archaeon HGW-Methanomicrobiales-4]
MTGQSFWIGIDDTDSPDGMCTTWLGSRLIRDLRKIGYRIEEARLIRLNPTIPHRTRGNAAVAIKATGDPDMAFDIACDLINRYADLGCVKTHPGVVVTDHQPPVDFYFQAVTAVCTIPQAEEILIKHARNWRGYKLGRGLIGATAAVASVLPDFTWELLAYRDESRWGTPRKVNKESIFTSEEVTSPHTWDSGDPMEKDVVCIPHTPDPVLFGIRGDSPFIVAKAVSCIISEPYGWGQIWLTNQGTDAHLLNGEIGTLVEGYSYRVRGTVLTTPETHRGGHVSLTIGSEELILSCMAFEPTKGFRHYIRSLIPGDEIIAIGSYSGGSLNLEKIYLFSGNTQDRFRAPFCIPCQKQMTSAGAGKGYKCRRCGMRSQTPEKIPVKRTIYPGWYEVPPSARRHLARPLIRGPGYFPEDT